MNMHQITTNYFVAAQISTGDVQEIVQAGFKAVICNRPDAEVPPSHQSAALENAARASGLEFYNLPLTHQTMTTEIVSQQMALSRLTGPVLAYCATGTRCTVAWAIGSANEGGEVDAILSVAQAAGYQLEGLRPTLDAIVNQR